MPGIPAPGTPDAHEFSQLFWSALYAALLASLVTGVVVGLVLWRVQARAERRREHYDNARALASLRERLRAAFDQPDVINPNSVAETAPAASRAAATLLAGVPVALWERSLPESRQFLDVVKALQRAHSAFVVAAGRLEFRLHQVVRLHNAARGHDTGDDRVVRFYAIGRLNGVSSTDLLPWVDRPAERVQPLEEGYNAVAADPDVRQLLQPYREARDRLDEVTRLLKQDL